VQIPKKPIQPPKYALILRMLAAVKKRVIPAV
jgi:hypothetical protein